MMPQRACILTKRGRSLGLSAKEGWIPIASPMPCRRLEIFAEPFMAEYVAETLGGDEAITIVSALIDEDGDMTFPSQPSSVTAWVAEYAELYPDSEGEE